MRDAVLTLLGGELTQNALGIWTKEAPQQREVFCQVESVTRAEFFEGGRNGLNPAYVFSVFHGDYNGETECIYEGQPYAIYRTYITDGDYMELYVERKGGTNGKAEG